MSDPDVFEIHGVACRRRNTGGGDMVGEQRLVTVREGPTRVVLDGRVSETSMTPNEARHLARSLYRCARRVETRAKVTTAFLSLDVCALATAALTGLSASEAEG